tara:strand:+ start:277 stop:642 length:366 start_codon:yes stop_codon:yes gene_type:complete
MEEVIATVGAILSMISNLPQVYKVRRANSTNDLHSYTIIMHLLSCTVWSIYGVLLNLYILGVESAICGILNILILLAMYRDGNLCNKQKKNDYKSNSTALKKHVSVCKSTKEGQIELKNLQ